MNLMPGIPQDGFALVDPRTGDISLSRICETKVQAEQLRAEMAVHHPHRPRHRIAGVTVTIALRED